MGEQPARRGFGTGPTVGLLIAVIAGLLTYIAVTHGRGSADLGQASSPTGSLSPSASPEVTPSPDRIPAEVSKPFNAKNPVEGEHLSFGVSWLPSSPNRDCLVHVYMYQAHTHGAFYSDCAPWEPEYDILLFYVALKNQTHRPVPFNLRNFILVSRDSRSFGPVNVRTHVQYPPTFLPERGQVPPGGRLTGWLTFDGRVQHLVPARLSYVDGSQTLTQTFEGGYHVVSRSG